MNKELKILVTGANGYIGSKVVKKLCDKGYNVIATDVLDDKIDKRATIIISNIFEYKDNWFKYFLEPDICIHLAWRDGFIHNSSKHLEDLSFHYIFLCNLINNGLQKISCMGTMHEIGYYEGMIDENTICNPLSNYGIAKNALRKSLEILCSNKNIIFQWLRAFYIFGDDLYGNSIFCKIKKADLNNEKFFPFTSGKNKYDFIHIDDLTEQIVSCSTQNKINGIINVCSGIPKTLSEQVEWYIKDNNLRIQLEYGKYPDRPYDSPCVYGDNSKIKRILNRGE